MASDRPGLPDHQTQQVGPPGASTPDQVPTHRPSPTKPGRPPQTVHIEELTQVAHLLSGQGWPWQQVGVFPTDDEHFPYEFFNYTVGLGPIELVVSAVSIEGRAAGNQLVAGILNILAAAWTVGRVSFGDSVIVPLGIPDEDGNWLRDGDSIWWFANEVALAEHHGVNVSEAMFCCPIIWSSPLGWAT